MRAIFSRAALLLAVFQASCLLSAAQLDQGDVLVKLVSEKVKNGEDWRAALRAHTEEGEAVASHGADAATAHLQKRLAARRAADITGSLEARRVLQGIFAMPSTTSKYQKTTVKQIKKKPRPSAFGKSAGIQAEADPDTSLQGTQQKNCAWQAYITGKMWNVAYPDTQAVYQVLVMLKVTEQKIFRIRGKFPTKGVRYFSLQSNNPDVGFPVTTIKDFEIEPDEGSGRNPFRDDGDGPVGTYTLHVTPDGKQGLPNELALCPEGYDARKCRNVNAVMLMRFYTSDPDRPADNSWTDGPARLANPRLWGYESPPVVEERIFKSWREFETCDQSRPTAITNMVMDHFSQLIPPFALPVRHNKNDNFVLYLGEDTAKAGVYPNLDASYLLAVGWQKPFPATERLIAKVTGVLPLTPRNLAKDPKIANELDYDVRYASFSSIALVEGGPTCDTLDDSSFVRFYGDRPGWNEHRTISFVVAPSKDETCGVYNENEDLFLTTELKGSPQEYWGILYRQLIPKYLHTGEPDHTNGYARIACSAMADNSACVDPKVLADIMGEFYPRIQYYTCSENGVLTPITETLGMMPIGTKPGN